jgi:ABC-type sugar transport system permease subunit
LKTKQYRSMIILFLAPVAILYAVFFLYPTFRAFYISLFDWSGFESNMTFIGLGNFLELFKDEKVWKVALPNTLFIIFVGGLFVFLLSFFLSGVLTTKIAFRKTFRAILFFPSVLSPVAIAILWGFIYNKKWGLLNNMLDTLGLDMLKRAWGAPDILLNSILVAMVWMYTGFYCVILVAALDRVPQSLLEAADIEGAGEFRKFFSIKLKLIRDVLTTAIILWCISAVKEFGLLYAWGGGIDIPPDGATNLAVKMYITAFGKRVTIFRMGYATAIGILMFAIVGIIVFLVTSWNRRHETIEY